MTVPDPDPVLTLLQRVRSELAAAFDLRRPVRVSRAPGRLDVMGGIADYTGSLVCQMPLEAGTAVALQERQDRQISLFSFNLLDEHMPFQLGMSLDALAGASAEALRRELAAPGRKWAAYVLGCLFLLHEKNYVNLADPRHQGLNVAIYSSLPLGGGVSSSAALEVATMMGLVDHFAIEALRPRGTASPERSEEKPWSVSFEQTPKSLGLAEHGSSPPRELGSGEAVPLALAALCQEVEHRIVGAPCGIMDQVACLLGEPGKLLRLLCQPHTLLPPLPLPAGVKVTGIYTGIRHSVGGGAYARTRAAAFMGHRMILEHMRHLGRQAGKEMTSDPTAGYLANLDPEDYKAFFRPVLPESITGRDFLARFDTHGDPATAILPEEHYPIQPACDHHVLEARRVRRFAGFLEGAGDPPEAKALRSAGRLMHASHRSYTEKAGLGHPAADVLIDLVRQHQPAGLYGARITGGGSGGAVAVLMDASPRADEAVKNILATYRDRTGHRPTLLRT